MTMPRIPTRAPRLVRLVRLIEDQRPLWWPALLLGLLLAIAGAGLWMGRP